MDDWDWHYLKIAFCVSPTTDYASPLLSGRSTIKLGKLAGYHKLSLELEIVPFLNFSHGILVFSSQHANGSGDFFSLALIDGCVYFYLLLRAHPIIPFFLFFLFL
jgi:hypothetical protein